MKRRARESTEDESPNKSNDPNKPRVEKPELEFEDVYGDDFASESHDEEMGSLGSSEDDAEATEIIVDGNDEEEEEAEKEIWVPALAPLQDGEKLEHDPSAYDMLHSVMVEWPCLSFDIFDDHLGPQRTRFPHTVSLAAGTQAAKGAENKLLALKFSELCKTKEDGDSDGGFDLDADSESVDSEPIIESKPIPHPQGCVNRLRVMPQQDSQTVVATMCDNGSTFIYDVSSHRNALDKPPVRLLKNTKPLFSFKAPDEGYGLAWNRHVTGGLITSDCSSHIFHWAPLEGGKWDVSRPLTGHAASVEDLQWSPTEANVFSSCSVDKTIKLWDLRRADPCVASIVASNSDVNVISWNTKRAFLILSGAEDGQFSVWDLRNLQDVNGKKTLDKPKYSFAWHTAPISSVEWNPNDDSTLAVASDDNSISIWDLSLSGDKTNVQGMDIPSQLMFVHHGQENVKEVHWHKQIPGVLISTAADGFNIFKPANI